MIDIRDNKLESCGHQIHLMPLLGAQTSVDVVNLGTEPHVLS